MSKEESVLPGKDMEICIAWFDNSKLPESTPLSHHNHFIFRGLHDVWQAIVVNMLRSFTRQFLANIGIVFWKLIPNKWREDNFFI